jgi:hypothetical protein
VVVRGEGEEGMWLHVMQECAEHIEPIVGQIELQDGKRVRLPGTNAATRTRFPLLGANHPRARSKCISWIKLVLFRALKKSTVTCRRKIENTYLQVVRG